MITMMRYFSFEDGEVSWSHDVGAASPYGIESKEISGCDYATTRVVDRVALEDGVTSLNHVFIDSLKL